MSAPILDYAKPSSHLPTYWVWVVIVVASTAVFFLGWIAYNEWKDRCYVNTGRSHPQSTIQTFRGQIELYKIQHADTPPDPAGIEAQMLNATNAAGDIGDKRPTPDFPLGPYLYPSIPQNPHNRYSAIGPAPAPGIGWVYTVHGTNITLQAVDTTGTTVLPD